MGMNIHDENEIKKEFQLERLIFFSDAVFAIIITIMILDVKLPEGPLPSTEEGSKDAFFYILLPKILAYTLTFFVVGSFWMRHLRIFSFLKDYNMQLIVINLIFLFGISLFPFALSFIFTRSHILQHTWGIFIYLGIIYINFFTQTLLIGYLIRNKEILCLNIDTMEDAMTWKARRVYYFTIPVIFILMFCSLYYGFSPWIVYGTLIAQAVIIRVLKRSYYPNRKNDDVTFLSLFKKAKLPGHPHTVKKVHH